MAITKVRVATISADFVGLQFLDDKDALVHRGQYRVPADRDFTALARAEMARLNKAAADPLPGDDITPVEPSPVEPDAEEVARRAFVAMVSKLRALQRAVADKIIVEGDAEMEIVLGEIKTALGEHPEYKELL